MDLSLEIGQKCREADALLAEKAKATSPLLQVKFFERGQEFSDKLQAMRQRVNGLNDQLIENYYYEQAELANFDGGSHNFSNSLARGHSSGFWDVTFMDAYGMQTSYLGYAMMRDPLSASWIPRSLNNLLMMCSDTVIGARGITGEMSSAWCASYYYSAALRDSSTERLRGQMPASIMCSTAQNGASQAGMG